MPQVKSECELLYQLQHAISVWQGWLTRRLQTIINNQRKPDGGGSEDNTEPKRIKSPEPPAEEVKPERLKLYASRDSSKQTISIFVLNFGTQFGLQRMPNLRNGMARSSSGLLTTGMNFHLDQNYIPETKMPKDYIARLVYDRSQCRWKF